jgi:glycosyltransferase involved in cell wall biosynthesis
MHPDIIHLHWIPQGFVSINSLQNIACPIVWTLHDSWPFTGGCHLPYDCERYKDSCGSCPALGSTSEQDISRWVFKRKKQAWKSLDITLVSPSFWLARCAQESSLFGGRRIEVIPNGLDLSTFQVMDKQSARSFFSLSGKTKVILFCAVNGLQDHNKGFHFLRSALADLAKSGHGANLELAIAGSIIQDDLPDLGVKTTQFGYIRDDYILNRLYSAADVVIIPSYQEAFGQTATESMACGTPVIAFAATGLLDIVDHQVNGYLARPFDTLDLAEGIHWVLELADYSTLSKNARKKVENYFDSNIVTAKYINLYEQILRKNLYHHDH